MAFTHQMTAGGAILRTASGDVQGSCCCGGAGNACSGTTCTIDSQTVPSMQLQIFDTDYSGGSITWCGQTWTQGEIQSGAWKCACPVTAYREGYYPQNGGEGPYWIQDWRNTAGGTYRLRLYRRYFYYISDAHQYYATNRILLNGGTLKDDRVWTRYTTTTAWNDFRNTFNLGLLTAVARPKPTDYLLTSAFFGSYLRGDGVMFTWKQGLGW